jgi:hypothetical protein
MSASANIHWTQDPQLLEEFVLHRVEGTRRKELEAHLLVCERCQQAVNEEQKIVLGIKRVGRDEMKARLKEHLVESQKRPVGGRSSWTWAYSAAAALVVLVGLAFYNRWLPFEKKQLTEERTIAQQKEPVVAEKNEARRESTVQPKPEDKKKESSGLVGDEKDKNQKFELRDDRRNERADANDLRAFPGAPSNIPPSAQGAGIVRKELDRTSEQLGKNIVEEYRPENGIWADGILLGEQSAERSKKALRMDENAAPSKQAFNAAAKSLKTLNATVTEFSIADLPVSQRIRQQRLQSNTVQTQFGVQGNELQLQLYRQEQQQQKRSKQKATLQQIGSDSIVVNVRGEQIGYKIQGGIDALMNAKKK